MRYRIPYQDLRRIRCDQMTAHIMQEISPILDRVNDHDLHRDVREALHKLLWRSGIEILTDNDRKNAGLPDRNNEGWTDDELRVLEARRLEMLLNPMPSLLVNTAEHPR